jgi:hypothetical protein
MNQAGRWMSPLWKNEVGNLATIGFARRDRRYPDLGSVGQSALATIQAERSRT